MVKSSTSSSNLADGSKLWDNEELVMTALKVYGKHPRPQCFNEISRVCKLSNLRKSRYFHEKMMKNNPYEKQIKKLIADEGEDAYPFFKIFFDEFKTKKERLKLMNNEEDKLSYTYKKDLQESSNIFNEYKQTSSTYLLNSSETNEEEFYQDGIKDESTHDYEITLNDTEHSINESYNLIADHFTLNNVQYDEIDDEISPLINSNAQYLENLELKLKLLNKEKESMSSYFQTFSSVVDNLKIEIDSVKSDSNTEAVKNTFEIDFTLDKSDLVGNSDLARLISKLKDLEKYALKLSGSCEGFEKDQGILKEDLKVTRNYAYVENKKLTDELNSYRAQLVLKDELIDDLKNQLDNSAQHSRVAVLKNYAIQSDASLSQHKFNDLKENMDKLFDKITNLT